MFEVDEEHAHYNPFPPGTAAAGTGTPTPAAVLSDPAAQFTPITSEGQDAEKAYAAAGGGYAPTDFGSQGGQTGSGFWGTALS